MPIWNPKFETMPRKELEEVQLIRLKRILRYVYERVPFYRKKFDEAGVDPDKLKTLYDIKHFPFTTKDDLRDNYPFGLFAVPMDKVVRIHASSGTTGKPTVVGYTKNDLEVWAEVVARIVSAGGVSAGDRVQVAFGYGLFTGGFGLHYGLEKVGATVIPASSGNTQRQIKLMMDFETTALVCTPSYALYIADVLKESGIDPKKKLKLKYGLFGAEPWSEQMRKQIESKLGITATDNYGLSEIIGPGVSGECVEYRDGLHINEDHFLVEIIDPQTGEPLPEGERGELVITTLTKEALPLIRYRTRDITSITKEPCKCGRTTARMRRVTGRTDDMFIIRGVNVFPSQVESVLLEIEGVEPHYQIILDREGPLDTMEVRVEVDEHLFHDEMKKLVELEEKIRSKLESVIGLKIKVRLVEPRTIERTSGKSKRVIDRRKI